MKVKLFLILIWILTYSKVFGISNTLSFEPGVVNNSDISENGHYWNGTGNKPCLVFYVPGGSPDIYNGEKSYKAGDALFSVFYVELTNHTENFTLESLYIKSTLNQTITIIGYNGASQTASTTKSITNNFSQAVFSGFTNIDKIRIEFQHYIFIDDLVYTTGVGNQAPTDISLSNNSINENSAIGTIIGSFSTIDSDNPGDTHTYSFTSGSGSGDSTYFVIDGSVLKTDSVFNYELVNDFNIRIKSTDSGGLSTEKPFTININDVNDPPIINDQTLPNINENAPNGTVIGTVSAQDQDNDILSFSITSGNDLGIFEILSSGNQTAEIKVLDNSNLNYEIQDTHILTVRIEDSSKGETDSGNITINVNDVNDPPTINDQTLPNINENAPNGTVIGTVSAQDEDNNEINFSISNETYSSDFEIIKNSSYNANLVVIDSSALDYETNPIFNIPILIEEINPPHLKDSAYISFSLVNIEELPEIQSVFIQDSIEIISENEVLLLEGTNNYFYVQIDNPEGIEIFYKWEFNNEIISTESVCSLELDYISHIGSPYILNLSISDEPFDSKKIIITQEWTINVEDRDGPINILETNIPEDESIINICESEICSYHINASDPDGYPLSYIWKRNNTVVSQTDNYTFNPMNLDGNIEVFSLEITDSQSKEIITRNWKVFILNNDSPIIVNYITPLPNQSSDIEVDTVSDNYNIAEGDSIKFTIDAVDDDGSLIWYNWKINGEIICLAPEYVFKTHFASSLKSPYFVELYLNGSQGDYKEFSWIINVQNREPIAYENSLNLNCNVFIEGIPAETGDIAGAFINDELRGIGEVFNNGNSALAAMEVFLNENIGNINFRIWNESENQIVNCHRDVSLENCENEVVINGYEPVIQSVDIYSGWNFVSFNSIPEDKSIANVFNVFLENISEIRSENKVFKPELPEYLNTLKEIFPGKGYFIKSNSRFTLNVVGMSSENCEYNFYNGWNLIGNIYRTSISIEDAFSNIFENIIEIRGEDGVYNSDNPDYLNTLHFVQPGRAYWIRIGNN